MSGTARNLIAFAPDGTKVTCRTSGNYDVAGLIETGRGRWILAARGSSWDSVRSRTRTAWNRRVAGGAVAEREAVVPMREEMPVPLEKYFAEHPLFNDRIPRIWHVFSEETGWQPAGKLATYATRPLLRRVQQAGFTAVAVGDSARQADFQLDELLKLQPARPARDAR